MGNKVRRFISLAWCCCEVFVSNEVPLMRSFQVFKRARHRIFGDSKGRTVILEDPTCFDFVDGLFLSLDCDNLNSLFINDVT